MINPFHKIIEIPANIITDYIESIDSTDSFIIQLIIQNR